MSLVLCNRDNELNAQGILHSLHLSSKGVSVTLVILVLLPEWNNIIVYLLRTINFPSTLWLARQPMQKHIQSLHDAEED